MRTAKYFALIPLVVAAFGLARADSINPAPKGIWVPEIKTDLPFDDVFPRKRLSGKSAQAVAWSFDDRYLAYLWNPYDDKGNDLWVYDAKEGKATRLTTIEMMAGYDRDTAKAIDRYKKDKEEEAKTDKMSNDEYRVYQIDKAKKDKERKEPLPAYYGPSEIAWAKKTNELLMVFKGDVYRWKMGDKEPVRLTRTREGESQVAYTADDKGYTYKRGANVFRASFESGAVVQLNPELPKEVSLYSYAISPDGTKLLIQANRSLAPERQVDYIVYRDRFAQARKETRGVADDKYNYEDYIFLYDLNDDPKTNPKNDGKPWEAWKFPGGEELWYTSIHEKPWSPDGKKMVFASWKQRQKVLEIWVADVEKKEAKVVYKTSQDGEHSTPGMTRPFFMPDGKRIVAMLETSGFRHAWMIDPLTEGASPITKGDFEDFPLEPTKDGKEIIVQGAGEGLERNDVYRVNVETGAVKRLTTKRGFYGDPTIGHNQERVALAFRSWDAPLGELFVIDGKKGGQEKAITESHKLAEWSKLYKIKPNLFTYKNRNGQTIYGYAYLPPNFKKEDRRPLFINVYGGPLGTGKSVVDGAVSLFDMWLSYAMGYVVVCVDPRGQSGYGAVFGKANFENPGKAQVEDLTDGVKYLEGEYGIDRTKVAVSGWSFGGFQTQMCMYTAPDVFTLGIAGAGPTEWQNYNTWYSGGVIGASRPGHPEDLDKYSLTSLAKNLQNPLLLLHGVEDLNVLYQDTIHVYQKLLQYGKGPLVELAIDPTGGHGMGGDMNTRDRCAIYVAFLMKHWGKPN